MLQTDEYINIMTPVENRIKVIFLTVTTLINNIIEV